MYYIAEKNRVVLEWLAKYSTTRMKSFRTADCLNRGEHEVLPSTLPRRHRALESGQLRDGAYCFSLLD